MDIERKLMRQIRMMRVQDNDIVRIVVWAGTVAPDNVMIRPQLPLQKVSTTLKTCGLRVLLEYKIITTKLRDDDNGNILT